MAPGAEGLHARDFAFEADFASNLRCIPMAVRRKLDLAGVKLKLSHWLALPEPERQTLVEWHDDPGSITDLRRHLLARTAALADGPARPLPPASEEPWQQWGSVPEAVLAACAPLGLQLDDVDWAGLDELQRFVLVKLSQPGHEHRNLAHALAEFLTEAERL
ncbi:nitrate reductase associated protein [Cyanobium sp. ATX 6F1]|uniref:nitrate reductase associated protein n=1 Tax=Cyanobium sp. ATX 6F1 TaxID=2823702 RepID=UPI0020CDA48A|nr:nitrate reductase associated protein [Cyanobium sp. ATX 6F1]MCP9917734.1 nitrate reductase associated protein [Cyanobium sp. ATX 6F1]